MKKDLERIARHAYAYGLAASEEDMARASRILRWLESRGVDVEEQVRLFWAEEEERMNRVSVFGR
jgi:hypothetical protein